MVKELFPIREPEYLSALRTTVFFTFISVALELVLGLGAALIMNRPFFGRGLVRAAVLIPWAIPTVISARMWEWMYNDQFGVINDILIHLHLISKPIPWLGRPGVALWAIIIADVWKTMPFMALLLLAGLQVIPEELYEAAKIDSAGVFKRFWYVTLPLLRPAVLVSLVFRTIDTFRVFDVAYVLHSWGERDQDPGDAQSGGLLLLPVFHRLVFLLLLILFLAARLLSPF